jgi:hypothetical protein
MSALRLRYQTLAWLMCIAAAIAAILTVVPMSQQIIERILAAFASIAFAYTGYCMYFDKRSELATRWQSFVWMGTILLMIGFLIRAVFSEGII